MKLVNLPLYDDPFYTYSAGLEGKRYIFTFRWNDRDSAWRMDIRHDNQDPIILGHKVVSSFPMMADYALQDDGLSGYFALLPKTREMGILHDQIGNMKQYYNLYYVYEG